MKNKFKDKRGREWEIFCDESYYSMWCVRCLDAGKEFNSQLSFHFMKEDQATAFSDLLKEAR
jgi:hypothetical protein